MDGKRDTPRVVRVTASLYSLLSLPQKAHSSCVEQAGNVAVKKAKWLGANKLSKLKKEPQELEEYVSACSQHLFQYCMNSAYM
jgi:hypothetical protein